MEKREATARFTWLPLIVVLIGAAIVLTDFAFNYTHQRFVEGSGRVRYFTYDQLYDLTLHLAMLATALAGALTYASLARFALSGMLRMASAPSARR